MFEFIMNGGKTGFSHILELQRTKKDIRREIRNMRKGSGAKALVLKGINAGSSFLEFLQVGNDVSENISRFSVYITSREMGRDVPLSISNAKEVSVNFNRQGAGGMGAALLKPMYMFMNAGIQGLSNFARVAYEHPGKMTVALSLYALSGYLQPMLAHMLGGDDGEDEYWRLSDHDRKNNFIIPTGNGNFLMMPISQELRIFHGIGDIVANVSSGRLGIATGMLDVMEALSDVIPLDPMSANRAGGLNVLMPDIVKPFSQAYTNKNYMGSPVYNAYSKDGWSTVNRINPGYGDMRTNKKGEPYSPDWIIGLAKGMDMLSGGDGVVPGLVSPNPDVVNHLARGYFGGIYTLLSQSGDAIYKAAADKPVAAKDIPFTNRFYRSGDDLRPLSQAAEEQWYDLKNEVSAAKGYLKKYIEKAKLEGVMKYNDEILKYGTVVKKWDNAIKTIENMEKDLKDMNPEQQKEREMEIAEMKKTILSSPPAPLQNGEGSKKGIGD
jgi:hypothetical protein